MDSETSGTNSSSGMASRIREEGLNHSHVMETLEHLTDVIGPRLTGSPNAKKANEWTKSKLESWGLTNCHLEEWGPFGRGWSLKRFSAQVVEPQTIPLIAFPSAWSPGLDPGFQAEVIHFQATNNAGLDDYAGKLKGAIVLAGAAREVKPHFEPLAMRLLDTNLLQLANAGPSSEPQRRRFFRMEVAESGTNAPGLSGDAPKTNATETAKVVGKPPQTEESSAIESDSAGRTNATSFGGNRRFQGRRPGTRYLSFLAHEGAAVIVTPSSTGDGGTIFVSGASVPGPEPRSAITPTNLPKVWATNVPAVPPQIVLAAEDYNRLVRMIEQGEKVKMAVDLAVQFHDENLNAFNTIAEIPGSDLKEETVMLGAHLDSWHSGTGATDNGAGVAATMEAMRILAALKVQPRRTIRLALWTGEEEGLLGSKAYVSQHLGYFTNTVESAATEEKPVTSSRKGKGKRTSSATSTSTNAPTRRHLVRQAEYEKVSAYFNLDNGAGKVRGIYLQGNESVRALFRKWLEPYRDLDAATISFSDTSSTDHISFDTIGVPGFQFIQDPLEYRSRTHHSNEDVFDRVPADDLKQAAVILAAFAFEAAMTDKPLPRKPLEGL